MLPSCSCLPPHPARGRCPAPSEPAAGAARGADDRKTPHLKNIVKPDGIDQRWKSPIGNPRVEDAIRRGAELFNWDRRKINMGIPLEGGWKRGIGMAIEAHGNTLFGAHRDIMALSMKANPDGTFVYYTGAQEMGNGSVTLQTMIIADVLGIRPENIEVIEADTDLIPYNLADYASRGVYVEGSAAKKVAESMRSKLAEKAAKFLICQTDEVEFMDRCVFVRADPERKITVSDVILQTQIVDQEEISAFESYHSTFAPTSYGAHFAEVWVNEALHKVKVVDYVAVHDVGKVLNPISIEAQVEGGIAMGMGYALSEGLYFDEGGNLINGTLKEYVCPHASDIPARITLDFIEENEPSGPYGAKSIGECAMIPSAPAIFNAVCNALGSDFHTFPIRF
jgi:CO/xanthine dehydrogenase Mo-binding subunit